MFYKKNFVQVFRRTEFWSDDATRRKPRLSPQDGLGTRNAVVVADRVFNVSAQSACRSCGSPAEPL